MYALVYAQLNVFLTFKALVALCYLADQVIEIVWGFS